MFSMIIPFITPAHAEFQPSVAHLEDNDKIYMLYYDENMSKSPSVVETTILFRNEDPNTTTFFMLMPSSVMNDNGTNNTGWAQNWHCVMRMGQCSGIWVWLQQTNQ